MRRTRFAVLILLSLVLLLSPVLSGCSLVSVVPGTDDEASETDPPASDKAEIISAEGFEKNGDTLFLTVPNATASCSFIGKITVSKGATWQVSSDREGRRIIPTKTVSLAAGDNTFYILVTAEDGNNAASYTVSIRRRPLYTVTFNTNGGSSVEPVQVEEGETVAAPTVTRTGYTFASWDLDFSQPVKGDLTATARWTAIDYPITYNLAGGTNAVGNPATYTIEDEITLADPTRENYVFLGWSDGGVIAPGSTGEKTFTANWMAETDVRYAVEYYRQNKAGTGYDLYLTENKGAAPGTLVTAEQKTFDHFTFLPDASTATGTVAKPDGSLVLKMYYDRETYTVTFLGNGGTLTEGEATQTVRYGNPAAIPTFTRNGYTFAGWDSIAGCDAVSENLTITAQWMVINYPITYNLGGGTNSESNPATYTVEDEITLAAPTRSGCGYTFAGWSDGGVIARGSTGEKIFTANWTSTKFPVPDDPYTPTPYQPAADYYTAKIEEKKNSTSGASIVVMPSREGVVYERRFPISLNLNRAETRAELLEIVNWHAFYRESGFSVTLGYAASDVDEELNYLWRNSDLLASQCSLFGTLENGVLTVDLKFYEEKYLATPRYTTPAEYIGVETTPPTGAETFPGLDPEHGVSVWDSEQACYALAHGYAISPIPGSPAQSIVNVAKTILAEIVDDSMTEWQIAYRVYLWLMNHAVYDQAEHWAGGATLRKADVAKESEAISSRLISFKAEGPLLYEIGACFGFAKASVLLLGLEGIELRRVVAFDYTLPGRSCILPRNGSSIAIHSYLYLRVGGYDYIFDPTHVGESTLTVGSKKISVYREFSIGLSFEEHRKIWRSNYPDPDFYAATDEYNSGLYNYLTALTYDGTHDLLLSDKTEAQRYYDFLLETVFSKEPEFRTVTLFYSTWNTQMEYQLDQFLKNTGVPYATTTPESFKRLGVTNGAMIKIVFGK